MSTRPDSRQVVLRSAQTMLGTVSNDSLDTIFPKINDEIAKLFEDRNVLLQNGGLITFTGTQIDFTENLEIVLNSKIAGGAPTVISLGSTSRLFSATGRMLYAVIDRSLGTAVVTADATTLPAVTSLNQEVFLIAKRVDAGDGTQRIYWRNGMGQNAGQTLRLGASGTGSGAGLGDDLITTQFQASFTDEFTESPTMATAAIDSAKTNATYNAAKGLYQISYDASKTVATIGTAATMSSAPSFTVAAGDVLISQGIAKRIVSVSSQTSYTLESAFALNLPPLTDCTISQAVHTKDIYNTAFDGSAIASAFSTSFSEILVDYEDTSTVGDDIFDIGIAPVVGFIASSDNSSWSTVQVRPTLPLTQVSTLNLPTSGSALYIRLFANKSSGSGTVNVLKYKAYMQKTPSYSSGGVLNSALAFTDSTGTPINCAVSTFSGKTLITLTWTYPVGINSSTSNGSLEVYLNGQKIPRYVDSIITPDASYTELSPTQVLLDQNYSSLNLSVEITLPAVVIDQSSQNSTYISELKEINQIGQQPFVNNVSSVLSATSSTPSTGQFWSAISNRASIVDISNDLKVSMGIDRIPVQQIYQLSNEFGSSGENVFAAVNDDRNLIRFVGKFENKNSSDGQGVQFLTSSQNSFIEITFYGTGLNWLAQLYASYNATFTYSVNGGSEVSISLPASASTSSVIASRNYNSNVVIPVVSNLALGVYTVRIKRTDSNATLFLNFGFEVLNSSSTLKVNSGISYANGKKLTLSSQQSPAYNSTFESGTIGTRGGRVLVYQKSDGTIAKSVKSVDASQLNLTAADHTNEEVARVYSPREFGAGRADDFSTVTSTASDRAFTLEDGTTTLVGRNTGIVAFATGPEGVYATNGTTNFYTFTFVGTGLDIRLGNNDANAKSMTVSVNGGASIGTVSQAANATGIIQKIVSGLPYGTHTVKFTNANAGVSSPATVQFTVYQPKKPTLPIGAIELADYNVMANYVANSTAGTDTMPTGILRKFTVREATYLGTWITGLTVTQPMGGWDIYSSTNGDYIQYTFFGTGFELRSASGVSSTWLLTVDGASNLSGFTTSSYGLTSFTASTGAIVTLGSTSVGGVSVSGLTLGLHTIRVTKSSGVANNEFPAIDVITPIHSYKSNLNYDQQNTLPIGSQSISDNRVFSPTKDLGAKKKNISQAFQITTTPTVSSVGDVPCLDLSVTHSNTTGRIRIYYSVSVSVNGTGLQAVLSIYVNGAKVSLDKWWMAYTSGATSTISDEIIANVPNGTNKIDVYIRTSGGGTATLYGRNLLVEEID